VEEGGAGPPSRRSGGGEAPAKSLVYVSRCKREGIRPSHVHRIPAEIYAPLEIKSGSEPINFLNYTPLHRGYHHHHHRHHHYQRHIRCRPYKISLSSDTGLALLANNFYLMIWRSVMIWTARNWLRRERLLTTRAVKINHSRNVSFATDAQRLLSLTN